MAAGEFALGLLNILHSNIIRRELRIPFTILRKAKALPGGVGNSFFLKACLSQEGSTWIWISAVKQKGLRCKYVRSWNVRKRNIASAAWLPLRMLG